MNNKIAPPDPPHMRIGECGDRFDSKTGTRIKRAGGATMKQLAAIWYNRARAAEVTVDILQTRLNVMRGVALVGWVGFVIVLMGV